MSSARAAYCDVDGTLAATSIVTPLIWLHKRLLPAPLYWLWLASLVVRGPYWLLLDKINRARSNRAIYFCYGGHACQDIQKLAQQCFEECVRPRLFPHAVERLSELRAEGTRIVLVTGGLDFIMKPLAESLNADCIAPSLAEKNGHYTGELTTPPLANERKAEAVRAHAQQHGIDLTHSYAMGDSIADLPMLECVGQPIVVNPQKRLAAIAQQRSWPIENWKSEAGRYRVRL